MINVYNLISNSEPKFVKVFNEERTKQFIEKIEYKNYLITITASFIQGEIHQFNIFVENVNTANFEEVIQSGEDYERLLQERYQSKLN